jgi:hypothetical protein
MPCNNSRRYAITTLDLRLVLHGTRTSETVDLSGDRRLQTLLSRRALLSRKEAIATFINTILADVIILLVLKQHIISRLQQKPMAFIYALQNLNDTETRFDCRCLGNSLRNTFFPHSHSAERL